MPVSLLSCLQTPHERIAVTGAGGKTSLLQLLAEYARRNSQNVLTTTTTHILAPGSPGSPLASDYLITAGARPLENLAQELAHAFASPPRHITLGEEYSLQKKKLKGLSPENLCVLLDMLDSAAVPKPCVIVEADGAARLSMKAHATHEPVIPTCMDMVIAVAGIDALNKPLTEVVHRSKLAAERLGLSADSQLTPRHMAALLLHPLGPFRDAPVRRAVLLNKCDTPSGVAQAQTVAEALHTLNPSMPCHAGSLLQGWTQLLS